VPDQRWGVRPLIHSRASTVDRHGPTHQQLLINSQQERDAVLIDHHAYHHLTVCVPISESPQARGKHLRKCVESRFAHLECFPAILLSLSSAPLQPFNLRCQISRAGRCVLPPLCPVLRLVYLDVEFRLMVTPWWGASTALRMGHRATAGAQNCVPFHGL